MTSKVPNKKCKITSPRGGPSSYRCRICSDTFQDRHLLYLHAMENHYQVGDGLQQRPWDTAPWEHENGTVDEELRQVYEANEPLILGDDQPGPIQSIYNFPVANDVSVQQLNRFAGEIYYREQHVFKLNLSFGMILQHRETGQYRYFTPYRNNSAFDSPINISRCTDLRRFYLRLRPLDILDQLLRNRPDTKWIPVLITNVEFYITGTNYPLGRGDLPDYLLHNKQLISINKKSTKWEGHEIRCIDGPTREFYQQWKQHEKIEEAFTGVSLDDLPAFEKLFQVDLEVYSLSEDGEASSVYKSRGRFNNSICQTCDRHFDHLGHFHRHQKICTGKTKYVYPGGFHKSPQTIFEKLEAYDIHVPQAERTYPYFIYYDFEALLQNINDRPTDYLSWTEKHVPISVSICSNVPGYTNPHCIIHTEPGELIKKMVEYMKGIAKEVSELAEEKWLWVVEEIEDQLNPDIYDMMNNNRPTFFQQFNRKRVTEKEILKGVQEEKLFGMVEVDIQVPEKWSSDFKHRLSPYEYFQEMSPLFCTTDVPFEAFGEHMQRHVENHNLSKASRRLLVGGMKAQQMLLASPLLKWYLDHGLQVTKVYQVVEYQQQRCFHQFVEEVSQARRKGDEDKNTAIIADTMKVIGNSAYECMIMDKSKHRDVQYVQGENETCLKNSGRTIIKQSEGDKEKSEVITNTADE
ncbi:hypothetical protein KUTeg_011238 [Tegillarca granosa]|uniref:C2H2-type domain-containing protein n=1 Tax=Tegillarca granosa TaxID=220873 RepID=A0ABQ9F1D3_TEGGR|nr:hypothetical protein KUTeg_011238 [Tegillarca granosa]